MKKCDKCGYENKDSALFCESCGEKLKDSFQSFGNNPYANRKKPAASVFKHSNESSFDNASSSNDNHRNNMTDDTEDVKSDRKKVILIIAAVILIIVLFFVFSRERQVQESTPKTYNVIGKLTFAESAYSLNGYSHEPEINTTDIANSAYNKVPDGVAASDWHKLINSINYAGGDLAPSDIKDGATVTVSYNTATTSSAAQSFIEKYNCTLRTDKNDSTEKEVAVQTKYFDKLYLTKTQLEDDKNDIVKAAEDYSEYEFNDTYSSSSSVTYTVLSKSLYYISDSTDENPPYLMCFYKYERATTYGDPEIQYEYYVYGPLTKDIDTGHIEDYSISTYASVDSFDELKEKFEHGDVIDGYKATLEKMTY